MILHGHHIIYLHISPTLIDVVSSSIKNARYLQKQAQSVRGFLLPPHYFYLCAGIFTFFSLSAVAYRSICSSRFRRTHLLQPMEVQRCSVHILLNKVKVRMQHYKKTLHGTMSEVVSGEGVVAHSWKSFKSAK